MWQDLKLKSVCWYCYCWKTSWIEYFFTLSTICFIRANLGEMLSSRTRTLFFSSLFVKWCKSVRLVNKWDSDQSWLIGIETLHLLFTTIFWLICRHEQTIDYFILQRPVPFSRSFISRTDCNSQSSGQWTHKIFLFSKCSNHFPTNAKVFSFSLAQKSLSGACANVW